MTARVDPSPQAVNPINRVFEATVVIDALNGVAPSVVFDSNVTEPDVAAPATSTAAPVGKVPEFAGVTVTVWDAPPVMFIEEYHWAKP